MCYTIDDLILNHNKNLDIIFNFVNRLTGKYYNNVQKQLQKTQINNIKELPDIMTVTIIKSILNTMEKELSLKMICDMIDKDRQSDISIWTDIYEIFPSTYYPSLLDHIEHIDRQHFNVKDKYFYSNKDGIYSCRTDNEMYSISLEYIEKIIKDLIFYYGFEDIFKIATNYIIKDIEREFIRYTLCLKNINI